MCTNEGTENEKAKKLKSMNQEDEDEDIKGTEHVFSLVFGRSDKS